MPNPEFTLPEYPDSNENQAEEVAFMNALNSQAPEAQGSQSTPDQLYVAEQVPASEAAQPLSAQEKIALSEFQKHFNTVQERVVSFQHVPGQEVE